MTNINFSLTNTLIINPVLTLRSPPLNTPENPLSFKDKVNYFFESEVATRIIAIATSFFAAIDSMVHLSTGVTKGIHFGLRKIGVCCLGPAASGAEIASHFKQSAKFLGVTLVGTIAATIWPDLLKYLQCTPSSGDTPSSGEGSSNTNWRETSETVQNLWNQRNDQHEFDRLWARASLEDRRIFVHLLDKDSSNSAATTKAERVNSIYKRVSQEFTTQWPSQENTPTFYHATSLEGLHGIIRSGKIEVRHEKAYRGAFVSTQPETGFGKYILVFNRNIERVSNLNHGFPVGHAYWAGFSRDISVNAMTLNKVLIHNGNGNEVRDLTHDCNTWAGRTIRVEHLSYGHNANKEIPKEWPRNDDNANAIQQTMQIRVQQRVAQPQRVTQRIQVPIQQQATQRQRQRGKTMISTY